MNTMKKNKPARLYPEKEDITLQNFLLENPQLLTLILLIIGISLIIIGCILSIDYFRSEHVYNFINGGI